MSSLEGVQMEVASVGWGGFDDELMHMCSFLMCCQLACDHCTAYLKPLLPNDCAADVIPPTLLRRCQPHRRPTKDVSPFHSFRGVIIVLSWVTPSTSVCLRGLFWALPALAHEWVCVLCGRLSPADVIAALPPRVLPPVFCMHQSHL